MSSIDTCIRNNRGLRTDPCGTPDSIVPYIQKNDRLSQRIVFCWLDSQKTIRSKTQLCHFFSFFAVYQHATFDQRLWKYQQKISALFLLSNASQKTWYKCKS